jgi:MarR family multiple antibiotic resistance transcriptional regulator
MASISEPAGERVGRLFDDLVRCETRLYNALNDRIREQHGIALSQFEFLRYLRGHPESRVADVAASFAIGIGATSKGADRLERGGWVRRVPNLADRRSSLLALTPSGEELVAAAEQTFTRGATDLIQPTLTPAQFDATLDALSALRTGLERRRAGVPTG